MSSLLYRIGRACFRAPGRVLLAWLVLLGLLGAATAVLGGRFDDGFRIPGASSQKALDQLKMTFPEAADAQATMLIILKDQSVDSPGVKRIIERHFQTIEELPYVKGVQSPYNKYLKGQISSDGHAALVHIRVAGSVSTFTDAQRVELTRVAKALEGMLPGSEVHIGGEVYSVHMPKFTITEAIGVVLALLVLLVTLGSVSAALMPIGSALMGVGLAVTLVMIGSGVIPVNSTTLMLAVMLALAVGIDYALFIVSRHRDQLATGMAVEESASRAVATAGSAVIFAGLTVIIALTGLAVANIPFLTVMGFFSASAVALEVALSLSLLPAFLGLAGERLRPKPRKPGRLASFDPSRWWVRVVTRFPVLTILLIVVALGVLAIPAKDLHLSLPNSGQAAPGSQDRITYDLITDRFGVGYNGPLVVTGTIVESKDPLGLMDELKAEISSIPGVKLVALAVPNENADTGLVQIVPETGPDDPRTSVLVEKLRAKQTQWKDELGIDTAITGYTAVQIDVSNRLAGALLPFGLFVVGLSLVLLTVVFRSIAVPIKAALGFLLSVGGAFGATNLTFNRGWFKEIINLHEPVPVISFLPIILMGILFGLAMDYEVFLTSRMREEHVHGNDVNATEEGFVHSAKVVVAAAVIMFSVFAFFVPAGEGVVKPIAFGLAIGVAIDAFLVRMTLGPAVMKLLGAKAWWLPAWLDRRLPVMDIEGEGLAHQLRLAEWPHPDAPYSAYAEGLAVRAGDELLFSGVNLTVAPGEVIAVQGTPLATTALAYGLTGRLRFDEGEAKVLNYALPEQASELRRHTHLLTPQTPHVGRELRRSRSPLIVVDNVEQLRPGARTEIANRARRVLTEGAGTLVVTFALDSQPAELLPAGFRLVTIPAPAAVPVGASSEGNL